LQSLTADGFPPRQVFNGEGECVTTTTERAVMGIVFDGGGGVVTIHFSSAGNTSVLLVPGNGVYIISDWHCSDPAFDAAVEKVCDWVKKLINEVTQ
jgi:hypothetical protein